MKILTPVVLSILLFSSSQLFGQTEAYERALNDKTATIDLHYFENEPMFYKAGETFKGIEVEILNRFSNWMKNEKGINLTYNYVEHQEFNDLYEAVKSNQGNHIGAGTVTRTEDRAIELDFSAPYLRNVSVLVSSSKLKTARNAEQLKELLSSTQAYTVKGSVHEQHLAALFKEYEVEPKIIYLSDPKAVFDKINESPRYIGYVDVITFWKYIKTAEKPVKMHKVANSTDEYFGFIFPRGSGWAYEFNEFFESGFGYTSTKEYHKMLEKYLSFEILKSVELSPY